MVRSAAWVLVLAAASCGGARTAGEPAPCVRALLDRHLSAVQGFRVARVVPGPAGVLALLDRPDGSERVGVALFVDAAGLNTFHLVRDSGGGPARDAAVEDALGAAWRGMGDDPDVGRCEGLRAAGGIDRDAAYRAIGDLMSSEAPGEDRLPPWAGRLGWVATALFFGAPAAFLLARVLRSRRRSVP